MTRRSFLGAMLAAFAPITATHAARIPAIPAICPVHNGAWSYKCRACVEAVSPFALAPSKMVVFSYDTGAERMRFMGWDSGIGTTPSASPRAP